MPDRVGFSPPKKRTTEPARSVQDRVQRQEIKAREMRGEASRRRKRAAERPEGPKGGGEGIEGEHGESGRLGLQGFHGRPRRRHPLPHRHLLHQRLPRPLLAQRPNSYLSSPLLFLSFSPLLHFPRPLVLAIFKSDTCQLIFVLGYQILFYVLQNIAKLSFVRIDFREQS